VTLPVEVRIVLPGWVPDVVAASGTLQGTHARMALAVRLAGENVEREAGGGPFGAAVFRIDTGALVSVGVNSVIRLGNSGLHAEVVALMLAHRALGLHSFDSRRLPGAPALELVTSCEPCIMCFGAAMWSGIRRLVCGATRQDAEALGFDEGPVTEESYRHLQQRGVEVVRGVLRAEARAVLQRYQELGRPIY
jgi:tRNA(Arg) A34 adenosine deaminase TadA